MGKVRGTYHGIDFLHDYAFGCLDGASGSDQANGSFVVDANWLRYIDLATGGHLHILDGFTTYAHEPEFACGRSDASYLCR